jgi:hypothetical protein
LRRYYLLLAVAAVGDLVMMVVAVAVLVDY